MNNNKNLRTAYKSIESEVEEDFLIISKKRLDQLLAAEYELKTLQQEVETLNGMVDYLLPFERRLEESYRIIEALKIEMVNHTNRLYNKLLDRIERLENER